MEPILKVNDINVYYGAIHAIKGISFEVNPGEIVTLIGANGAGKSTTLQTVSGLLHSRTVHRVPGGEPFRRPRPQDRGQGPGPGAGGTAGLSPDDRGGKPGDGRLHPVRRRHRRGHGKGLQLLSPSDGAAAADCRHPVRRRTADAGHGPCPDEPPQAADAG